MNEWTGANGVKLLKNLDLCFHFECLNEWHRCWKAKRQAFPNSHKFPKNAGVYHIALLQPWNSEYDSEDWGWTGKVRVGCVTAIRQEVTSACDGYRIGRIPSPYTRLPGLKLFLMKFSWLYLDSMNSEVHRMSSARHLVGQSTQQLRHASEKLRATTLRNAAY